MIRSQKTLTTLLFLIFHVLPILAQETVDSAWIIVDVGESTKPSFDFDSQDRIHIMGITEAFPGFVQHWTANDVLSEWNEITVATGYFYGPGDLIVTPDDRTHIAWHDHDQESPRHVVLNGSEIVADNTIPTLGQHDGWDNALAFDGNGTLHMASVDPSGFGAINSLQHGTYNDSWDFESAIQSSGGFMYGFNAPIAVDSENAVHILYCQSPDWLVPGDLRYAVKRDGIWTFTTVVGNGIRGRFPSIAIDSDNNVHASWLDMVNPSQATVQYGFLPTGSSDWQITAIDTLNNVTLGFSDARKSTSIVVDSMRRPRIAYSDNRIVKYATNTNGSWKLNTVIESNTDLYKGLVVLRLDSQDQPGIVFWNPQANTAGKVRFARPIALSSSGVLINATLSNDELVLSWEASPGDLFSVEKTNDLINWVAGAGTISSSEDNLEYREPADRSEKICFRIRPSTN